MKANVLPMASHNYASLYSVLLKTEVLSETHAHTHALQRSGADVMEPHPVILSTTTTQPSNTKQHQASFQEYSSMKKRKWRQGVREPAEEII